LFFIKKFNIVPRSPELHHSCCTASHKERRKCPVVTSCHTTCNGCGYWHNEVAEIPPNTRGGETGQQSAEWRHLKKVYGIAHGDD